VYVDKEVKEIEKERHRRSANKKILLIANRILLYFARKLL